MHPQGSRQTQAAAAVVAVALALLLAACGGSSSTSSTTKATTSAAVPTVTATTSPDTGTGTTGTGTTGTAKTGTSTTGTGTTGAGTTGTTAAAPKPSGGAAKLKAHPLLRVSSLAACLQKAAATLRNSASNAKTRRAAYQAADKQCLADAHLHIPPAHIPGAGKGGSAAPKAQAPRSAQATAELVAFAECLRRSGLNVPAPSTSGTGPVIDLKGLDAKDAHTRALVAKCQPKK